MGLVGKIDKSGVLYIQRGNKLMEQFCPYSGLGQQHNCSHLCPRFGEPIRQKRRTLLSLCGQFAIVFDKFKDEREEMSENPV